MTAITKYSYKAVGGAFLFKALRTLPLIFSILFLTASCQKEQTRYPEIQAYHAESQNLRVATADSVALFSQKGPHRARHDVTLN